MNTRSTPVFVALIFLVGCGLPALSGCGSESRSRLKERARAFGDLLVSIRDMDGETAGAELERFLEPAEGRDERIDEYIADFHGRSEKFRIVSHLVKSVSVKGDVMKARGPVGSDISVEQRTQWYRTLQDPGKRLK